MMGGRLGGGPYRESLGDIGRFGMYVIAHFIILTIKLLVS